MVVANTDFIVARFQLDVERAGGFAGNHTDRYQQTCNRRQDNILFHAFILIKKAPECSV